MLAAGWLQAVPILQVFAAKIELRSPLLLVKSLDLLSHPASPLALFSSSCSISWFPTLYIAKEDSELMIPKCWDITSVTTYYTSVLNYCQ